MPQRTSSATAPSSRKPLLRLFIAGIVIAALSGHLGQILNFLLELVRAVVVLVVWVAVGTAVVWACSSLFSSASTGASRRQAPLARVGGAPTVERGAVNPPPAAGSDPERARDVRAPMRSDSAASAHGAVVARGAVRPTPAQERPVGGGVHVRLAQTAARRSGQPHLLVLGPEHTQFLKRVDPYTRRSFRIGEQAVYCDGCGNLYKLVTCEALEHRCPIDGASLRPAT